MLWHRQAIFESKGDKLSSSAESRIRTHQGLRHQIASRLNAHWQTDWAIEDQAKNLNSTARPYDQRAFSPLDVCMYVCTYVRNVYIYLYINTIICFLIVIITIYRYTELKLFGKMPLNQSYLAIDNNTHHFSHFFCSSSWLMFLLPVPLMFSLSLSLSLNCHIWLVLLTVMTCG